MLGLPCVIYSAASLSAAVVYSELVRAADMLEIGVTNINMHDCGINRNEACGGLTVREARTHFAAVSCTKHPAMSAMLTACPSHAVVHRVEPTYFGF